MTTPLRNMARITFSEIHVSFNKRNELTGHFVTFMYVKI